MTKQMRWRFGSGFTQLPYRLSLLVTLWPPFIWSTQSLALLFYYLYSVSRQLLLLFRLSLLSLSWPLQPPKWKRTTALEKHQELESSFEALLGRARQLPALERLSDSTSIQMESSRRMCSHLPDRCDLVRWYLRSSCFRSRIFTFQSWSKRSQSLDSQALGLCKSCTLHCSKPRDQSLCQSRLDMILWSFGLQRLC